MPLASEVAQDCKKKAVEYGRVTEPISNSPLDTYSHWLEKAYPQASQRQRYFKELIENKPISHANFRLAHLLSEKRLATLVVTPNFDDFLSRALTLFGQGHIVCDHPNTVERIDTESTEIQIVHVHGTYWFYDCCNLRGEIEARTQDSRERAVTMTSLLDTILSRHSPIVMGYAGWDGDVIMTALKRRLQSGLRNNLYWFAFRRSDLERLRLLLIDHRDVCVVLPDVSTKFVTESRPASEEKVASTASESELILTAQSVLDKLVGAFTSKSPALTLDPVGFFAEQLKKSFPQESLERPGEDIYELRDVIRRVEAVRSAGEERPTAIEAQIEQVRDAVRRSSYREALATAGQINPKPLTPLQREALIESAMSAALGLNDNSQAELDGYDLVLRLAAGTAARRPAVRRHTARALVSKGITLGQLNRGEEAIAVYEEVVRRFGDSPDPTLRQQVGKAILNKGITLGQFNRGEEAIAVYEEVVRRFADSPDATLREQVAKALVHKSFRLGQLNRSEEEIAVDEEVVRRFGDSPDAALLERVAWALFSKGFRLGQLNRSEEAIAMYEEVVRRFGDSPDAALREHVARALVNKGITLGQLNRIEEAIAVYEEVVQRFGDSPDAALRDQVAKALVNRGFRLGQLNRNEEAIAVYEEVVRRFGDSPDATLREQVAKALVNKGLTLGRLNRIEEALAVYEEVVRRFDGSPDAALKKIAEEATTALKSLKGPLVKR